MDGLSSEMECHLKKVKAFGETWSLPFHTQPDKVFLGAAKALYEAIEEGQ